MLAEKNPEPLPSYYSEKSFDYSESQDSNEFWDKIPEELKNN